MGLCREGSWMSWDERVPSPASATLCILAGSHSYSQDFKIREPDFLYGVVALQVIRSVCLKLYLKCRNET